MNEIFLSFQVIMIDLMVWKFIFLSLILMGSEKEKGMKNLDFISFDIPKIVLSKKIYISIFILTALANEDKNSKPFINPELSPNVTGVLGKEIRLACHVEDLGNKTVS